VKFHRSLFDHGPSGLITPAELYAYELRGILCDQDNKACEPLGFGMMKTEFCIFGATRGTGLLIAQQLLEGGSSVRVLARDPDKARGILGNRVEVCHGDVTDPRSVRDAINKEHRAIFFTVAATGGVDGRGLFASETAIRKVTYQGLLNLVDAARSRGFQGRLILPSVMGADRTSVMIRFLDKIKSGLQRNLLERELYLKASGLDYAIVRAPILTNVPAGNTNIRIAKATNMLTAGPKISRGDLARVMILVSRQTVASRKTFDLLSAKGLAPSDQQLLAQIEQIPVDIEVR
jgi:nucleoside-diphosphate-sugar epimerase